LKRWESKTPQYPPPICRGGQKETLVKHLRECTLKTIESTLKAAEYDQQWPGYCRKCNGVGHHNYPSTRDEPGGCEPCSCVEDNTCPRCGGHTVVWLVGYHEWQYIESHVWCKIPMDGETPFCPSCGWLDSVEYSTPGRPEVWECDCWLLNVPDDIEPYGYSI